MTLLVIESVFWMIQKKQGASNGFFFHLEPHKNAIQKVDYCETDPLLGWSISDFKQFQQENGDLILSFKAEAADKIDIYISGGSTSDLLYDSLNWPHYLLKECRKENIPVKIRIAAVAGYNTGQELLKLITTENYKPDIHISYAGANEIEHPDYVSLYESEIFQEKTSSKAPIFLPNTISFIRSKMNAGISIKTRQVLSPYRFWKENIFKMNQLAKGGEYVFYAVLQPVAGFRNKKPTALPKGAANYIRSYPTFYKKASLLSQKQSFILDLSGVFEKENRSVFEDDCHLKDSIGQRKIAKEIMRHCIRQVVK